MNQDTIFVKKFLLDIGKTQTQLAEDFGMHVEAVNAAIHNKYPAKKFWKQMEELYAQHTQ